MDVKHSDELTLGSQWDGDDRGEVFGGILGRAAFPAFIVLDDLGLLTLGDLARKALAELEPRPAVVPAQAGGDNELQLLPLPVVEVDPAAARPEEVGSGADDLLQELREIMFGGEL